MTANSSTPARIFEVKPRETSGSLTGRAYEYQHEQSAATALELLVDAQRLCHYCDWHDDFVVESAGATHTLYHFHQVKSRTLSQGPWKFSEVFGVTPARPSKKPGAFKKGRATSKIDEALCPHLLHHHRLFSSACAATSFITNNGLAGDVTSFLNAINAADKANSLAANHATNLQVMASAYMAMSPPLVVSEDDLFDKLKGMAFHTDQGVLTDPSAARLHIANRLHGFSEVPLDFEQAKTIATELIDLVRHRSTQVISSVPLGESLLQSHKGIVVSDVLGVLSLSSQAFRALRNGGDPNAIRSLSRLTRFCAAAGWSQYVERLCDYKALWDAWRTRSRHVLGSADFLALEGRANDILSRGVGASGATLEQLIVEAKALCHPFVGSGMTPEHALGLLISRASQAEM